MALLPSCTGLYIVSRVGRILVGHVKTALRIITIVLGF